MEKSAWTFQEQEGMTLKASLFLQPLKTLTAAEGKLFGSRYFAIKGD